MQLTEIKSELERPKYERNRKSKKNKLDRKTPKKTDKNIT